MATFTLQGDKVDIKGAKSQHTIIVVFDNPDYVPEKKETVTTKAVEVDENDNPVLDESGEPTYEEKEVEVVTPAQGFKQLVFEQEVLLPDTDTDKAAQEYADQYEKDYLELHKKEK